eukprot:g42915.t1
MCRVAETASLAIGGSGSKDILPWFRTGGNGSKSHRRSGPVAAATTAKFLQQLEQQSWWQQTLQDGDAGKATFVAKAGHLVWQRPGLAMKPGPPGCSGPRAGPPSTSVAVAAACYAQSRDFWVIKAAADSETPSCCH